MIYFLSESFIWLMWFWFISLGCTLVSGQGLCGLTQLHNLDELELTNCPSATREVCLYLRENMTHCLVVDWKTPPNNTCSILLESPGKKKTHSLSRDLFKFWQDHMRFSSFVTTCLAVLAFYPNSGNGRTRRPDITILHLRIHIVLLWLKTSTAYFFLIKTVSTTHPPLFHYPLFLCDSFKIFYTCTFKFPPFVFFLFLTNLIYLITGNKKRKKYVVSLLHCGGVRYRVMIRRSSASPYV